MSYVSRLRSAIGEEHLVTREHGYELALDGASFDATDFELALAEARFGLLLAALVLYFGAFNFLEARLPAALTEAAGEATRGAALGVFATCQFAGAFAGRSDEREGAAMQRQTESQGLRAVGERPRGLAIAD